MANLETHDLMSIGRHCAFSGCGQVDFLPFTCDCCSQTFCLEHRTYSAHACPKSGHKETEIIICPLCAKAIKISKDDDVNVIFERHQRDNCDPSNYAKVHKKKLCPVDGCREKLTTVNKFECKKCNTEVCLKHRLSQDHQCKEREIERRVKMKSSMNRFQLPTSTTSLGQTTMNMIMPSSLQKINRNATTTSSGRVICQACGKSFATRNELEDHRQLIHVDKRKNKTGCTII